MNWWDTITIKDSLITFVPVHHWSSRTPFDKNETLWGGWWFENETNKLLHLGDTGYTYDFDTIYNEVKSLVKMGRKKIGFITAINNLNVGKHRSNGYRKACVDFFGKFDDQLILKLVHQTNISHIENSEYYRKNAHNSIENFIRESKGLDAIIAADNISGILAVNTASKLNIDIPKDLSLIHI